MFYQALSRIQKLNFKHQEKLDEKALTIVVYKKKIPFCISMVVSFMVKHGTGTHIMSRVRFFLAVGYH